MGMFNNLKVHPKWIPPRVNSMVQACYDSIVANLLSGNAQFQCGLYATCDDYSINEDGKLLIHTTSWHDFIVEMDKEERECLEDTIVIGKEVWVAKFTGEIDPDVDVVFAFKDGVLTEVKSWINPEYSWKPPRSSSIAATSLNIR